MSDEAERLEGFGVVRLRAENPGPLTLSGTNTWVLGRDPAYVVDPGPALDAHLDAVAAALAARGGCGGIAVTHDHADHVEGVAALRERVGPVPVAALAWPGAGVKLADGDEFGPLLALSVPGHAPDHVVFVFGAACCTGDAVLGEGSVFVQDALGAYLDALRDLRARGLSVLLPGHGPPIWDPAAKLDEYLAHRAERERLLLEALALGLRSEADLLDHAWADAPTHLRPAAALSLRAHLEKLRAEGRA